MSRILAMVSICLLASACVDSTTVGPGGPTSSSSGGGQGGDGGSGPGPGGGAVDCSAFEDDEPGPQVTFTVTNNRATPIYYHNAQCSDRFRVAPEGGQLGNAELSNIEMTCEEVQTAEHWPLDCHDATVIEIAAGQSATFGWTGVLYERQQMPSACAVRPDNPFVAFCSRAVAVQPGALEIAIELFGAAKCELSSICSYPSAPFTVKQDFTYPDDTAVAIAID
ncbi:hypothetical protein [Sorangium sp. So ce394]|uniref:hypothetical protein n=1 Tax=Sorangium sp. So ce394 TaxID=3133310 RepID=UPI003F5C54D8